ncbi:MAG TPA: inositol monophosphatase family protein [Phycisphaerales bacterium]|nr:inositol monophosphatase family protein [Phycisphaerales bacterium]
MTAPLPTPTFDPLPPELPLILGALASAGSLTRAAQHALVEGHIATKHDGSIVTIADYAAQALTNRLMSRAGVHIPAVVGEESAAVLGADPGLLDDVVSLLRANGWPDARPGAVLEAIDLGAAPGGANPPVYYTIDPIDGTKGFAAGRQFAVCLARIDHGRCTLAALACPNLSASSSDPIDTPATTGTLFAATDASPVLTAPINDPSALAPLPVRPPGDVVNPVITFSVEPSEARLKNFDALAELLGGARRTPADSQAKYAMVARGQADAYFRPPRGAREKVWDHAAGCLLLERAGCMVTDLQGGPIRWDTPSLPPRSGILGAPPALHRRILDAVLRFKPLA